MEKKAKLLIGFFTLVFIVGLNVCHAFNDYGVKENKLHTEILDQTGTSGGSSSGSDMCMSYVVDYFVTNGSGSASVACEGGGGTYCLWGSVQYENGEIVNDYRTNYYCL